jgi:hypothetical protein
MVSGPLTPPAAARRIETPALEAVSLKKTASNTKVANKKKHIFFPLFIPN